MIHLEPKHQDIISEILKRYPYTFCAFGSRVTGRHQRFSDLDLCIMDAVPETVLVKLEDEFEQSDLPYKVDIIEWHKCDVTFQQLIKGSMVSLSNH